jgi:signal transduction histidine kinase
MPNENPGANRRILIVDDNAAIHEDFRKILAPENADSRAIDDLESLIFGDAASDSQMHFELAYAHQGQEALARVEEANAAGRPFALAFVDIRMPPGWDGVETISRIWAIDADLQVVICTAYSDYGWEAISERLGQSDRLVILKKPFDHVEALQLAHTMTNKWNVTRHARLRTEDLETMVVKRTAALEAAQERARQTYKMEAVGRLAAGIAHDFNNVLTVIQGYASRQLTRAARDAEITEAFTRIIHAAERAADLTRQLLAFSGKQVMHTRLLRLNEQIERLEPLLRPMLTERVELRLDLAASLPPVVADPTNLDEIIINLAMNACEAIPKAGIVTIKTAIEEIPAARIPATASGSAPGPHLRITVSDTGIGMNAETASHIFEPFFTTKEMGQGTGMGLCTVLGVVQQHRGWIDLETRLDHGSSFHIYLPAAEEAAIAPVLAPAPLETLRGTGTVLIAEDEEAVNMLAACTFEEHGFKVLTALSGVEALKLWESHADEIVLLFTDMVMPGGVSGHDLSQQLRSQRPELPVIFSSGYSRDLLDGGMQLEEGVNYLPKPYRPGDLSTLLANFFPTTPAPGTARAA